VQNINEIVPNLNKVVVFEMPSVLIIGKAKRNTALIDQVSMEKFWAKCEEDKVFDTLKNLPKIIPNHILGWTGDCPDDEKNNPDHSFTYMISAMFPLDTPIPDNLDYRVLHKNIVGKGLYGMEMKDAINEFNKMGYEPNWDDNNGWNSELYLDGEEERAIKNNGPVWSWLIPLKVKK
jgi:hypothetical protein